MAPPLSIQLLGGDSTTADAMRSVLVGLDGTGLPVVGEGCLDQAAGEEVGRRLAAGDVVVVLAQTDSSAAYFPVPVLLQAPAPQARQHLTVDRGVLPSLVPGELTVGPLVAGVGPAPFPDRPVVWAAFGAVVGSHQVGPGRLVFCQFEVCAPAAAGHEAGRAVLAELLRWAGAPHPTLAVEQSRHADGRRVARYSRTWTVAR